ncbi:hypothetical protein [Mesorhizobium sp. KR9-304]|uniref:hypothetical protein n=1 Tax=Mesorhizobium sp. KR9-304 TaxID=3156614 RepID=UPI0032B3AB69
MTEQEFERLKRRFGADVSLWPAPHRQEGLAHLSGKGVTAEPDDELDRLILDAARADTDEVALTRKVLAKIAAEGKPAGSSVSGAFRRMWTMPAAASGFAALLLVAALAGYTMADRGMDAGDDALMAFALGGESLDGGILDQLGAGEEEQL